LLKKKTKTSKKTNEDILQEFKPEITGTLQNARSCIDTLAIKGAVNLLFSHLK